MIKAEVNEIEKNAQQEKVNKATNWFFGID